ncbi:hypothetical protein LO762_00670 [Actinocorallia sp. API 0066]|uniref:hypothetical protein n=1 Tax=Actinocorallia sp. API 0066 TaxID=2896846 RepID=UPI001E53CC80|nr:hypothetical protein [Actinocorallia sp. API 0066]MCD0447715.1 hypothetical protein [Actinocorallia sp. API 0066]
MNKKILIGALSAALVLGLAVAIPLALRGEGTRHADQAAMLRAVPAAAKAELGGRGQPLEGALACESMEGASADRLLVRCTGQTAAKKPVHVFGAAMPSARREYYTILVDGRPLVKNAPCLGADCEDD